MSIESSLKISNFIKSRGVYRAFYSPNASQYDIKSVNANQYWINLDCLSAFTTLE